MLQKKFKILQSIEFLRIDFKFSLHFLNAFERRFLFATFFLSLWAGSLLDLARFLHELAEDVVFEHRVVDEL